MVKVAISGYYGFKNFGDEAILSVLVAHLKALGADVTVFSGDTEYTESVFKVEAVNRFDFLNIFKTIKASDILISGGGSLLQDVTSLKSLLYYTFIIIIGILFNKKIILFAQGIGPINNNFTRFIVKNVLKYCAYVSVRDENSLNLLKSWNIKADLVCDPIYSLNVKINNPENIVGVQLRDFKTMNYNLLHKIAQLLVTKFSDKKIRIFSFQNSQDLNLCLKFKNLLLSINPNLEIEIVEEDIINKISTLQYFFAMRFHAILIAIKCGVKTCAINYDIKVEKLAQDAGLPIISMNAQENFEEIYNQTLNLNSDKLLHYSKNKNFDWTCFDSTLLV